jgi:hypothetical protein
METTGGPPEKALQAFATLLNEVLAEPKGRKDFFADPHRRLGELDLPSEVSEFFAELSYEELRLLGKTCERMKAAGLAYDLPGGGRVCFL